MASSYLTQRRHILALGACASGLMASMSARAQTTPPNCADIPGVVNPAAPPAIVYGLGGSAIAPLIAELGVQLYQAKALVVVYNSANGACSGPNALIGNTKITGTATYWASRNATTGLPVASTCQLAIAGDDADFGAANNSALSCPGITALPADVGQFQGGASSANFIVPLDSLEQSISAAAAYLVYGFADVGGVAPWVNPAQIFRRDQNFFPHRHPSRRARHTRQSGEGHRYAEQQRDHHQRLDGPGGSTPSDDRQYAVSGANRRPESRQGEDTGLSARRADVRILARFDAE